MLFKYEYLEDEKAKLLAFGHQDSDLGALRVTTFRIFEDDGGDTLKAQPETFTLLDIVTGTSQHLKIQMRNPRNINSCDRTVSSRVPIMRLVSTSCASKNQATP